MRTLLRVAGAIDRLNRRVGRGVAWLTLVMVVVGAYNAFARYLERDVGLQLSSNGLLELQWYLFSLVFLLGAPYALRRNAHVRVDVLYGGHTRHVKAWIDLMGGLLFLIPFCAFAAVASWSFVADSIRSHEMSNDPGGLPRFILKPVVPLTFVLLGLQGIAESIRRLALLRGYSPESAGLEPEEDS